MVQVRPTRSTLLAAGEGDLSSLETLICEGMDVDGNDDRSKSDGRGTPLFEASSAGHLECVQFLLGRGAGLDLKDSSGVTALAIASFKGHANCIGELITARANVSCTDNEGDTPLHVACSWNNVECADLLIRAGASVHVQNKRGWAALHWACEGAATACVELLIEARANALQRTSQQRTPRQIAERADKVVASTRANCVQAVSLAEDAALATAQAEADAAMAALLEEDAEEASATASPSKKKKKKKKVKQPSGSPAADNAVAVVAEVATTELAAVAAGGSEDVAGSGVVAAAEAAPPRTATPAAQLLQPPSQYECPVSFALMVDPVCTVDGMVYERKAITSWLSTNDTSPLTGQRLESKMLIPQHALRSLIEEWKADNQG